LLIIKIITCARNRLYIQISADNALVDSISLIGLFLLTFSYLVYDVVNELIRFDAGEVVFINKLLQQLKQSLVARNFQH
jgi:hypothetical protein